ncbi:hypothetical protein [Leifsonia lichenia]
MRVLLKFLLDCDPDAAWRALQSPTAFREVSLPWVDFRSDEPAGFPTVWGTGEHRVDVRAFGAFTVGTQAIRLSATEVREPLRAASGGRDGAARGGAGREGGRVRILRDSGGGTGGLLTAIPHLDHRMAIAPDPAGPDADGRLRTLYRDQLIVKAGVITPVAWYAMWAFWQWRGIRLRKLAPTWAYDPPRADSGASAGDARDDDGPEHPATEREEQP